MNTSFGTTAIKLFFKKLLLFCLCAGFLYAQEPRPAGEKPMPKALAPVKEDPSLPNVLLVGDSISIGYTLKVRELLKGKANVLRPGENCGASVRGVQKIDQWLGDKKWAVVHFNFGAHDVKRFKTGDGKNFTDLETYIKNLTEITRRIKAKSARVIFATSAPFPPKPDDGNYRFDNADIIRYNEAALKIMREEGVIVDDLYRLVFPVLSEYQIPRNVHFTKKGSDFLAAQVARCIEDALSELASEKP